MVLVHSSILEGWISRGLGTRPALLTASNVPSLSRCRSDTCPPFNPPWRLHGPADSRSSARHSCPLASLRSLLRSATHAPRAGDTCLYIPACQKGIETTSKAGGRRRAPPPSLTLHPPYLRDRQSPPSRACCICPQSYGLACDNSSAVQWCLPALVWLLICSSQATCQSGHHLDAA